MSLALICFGKVSVPSLLFAVSTEGSIPNQKKTQFRLSTKLRSSLFSDFLVSMGDIERLSTVDILLSKVWLSNCYANRRIHSPANSDNHF